MSESPPRLKEKGIRLHLLMREWKCTRMAYGIGDIAVIFEKYNLSQSLNMLNATYGAGFSHNISTLWRNLLETVDFS